MNLFLKIVLIILAVIVVLVAILNFAKPWLIFKMMFTRPKRSTKVPSFYKDSPHYKVSRAGLKVLNTYEVEDKYITSRDGLKLHAYMYPASNPSKKFFIGIHGYRSYARPEYAPYAEFYHSEGFNILLPDDRAHAPSEGEYIGFGVLDRLDCVDWAKYVVETYGKDVEILIQGVSMGGATVLAASGEADLPSQVKGIISDCGFSSAQDILDFQLKNMARVPSAGKALPKLEKICEKKSGFNFHDYSAKKQVKKATVPILFVQGGQDKMVPSHMAEDLYKICPTKKKLLMVPEAGHAESIAFAPDEYYKDIKEMFSEMFL